LNQTAPRSFLTLLQVMHVDVIMKDKRSKMVWLAVDERRLKILKTGFRSRNTMFTVFFNNQVIVVVDIMPENNHCCV
jgi:hypothetical protein